LPDFFFADLAVTRFRQRIPEKELARPAVARVAPVQVAQQIAGLDGGLPGFAHGNGHTRFAPLRIRHAQHRNFGNARMHEQDFFHLARPAAPSRRYETSRRAALFPWPRGCRGSVIRIGFQRHTPPFSFVLGESFKPVGYAVDLAQNLVDQLALACRCPLSILPIETTSTTREAMLLAGEFDIECGSTTITELRRQRVAFSRPIFYTSHRLALRRDVGVSPGRALRITGITSSTSHSALLREPIAGLHFEFQGHPSIGDAFDAYRHDSNIDGLIADEMILFGLLGQAGDEVTLVHEQRLGSEEYGFMLRQSDRELLEAVDRSLEKSLGAVVIK